MTEYICSVCKYNTSRKDLITKHMDRKIKCKSEYENLEDYEVPERRIIEIPVSFTCKQCTKKFKTNKIFQKHKETCYKEIQKSATSSSATEPNILKELELAYKKIKSLEKQIEDLKKTRIISNNSTNNINIYVMTSGTMENVMKSIPLLLNDMSTKDGNKTFLIKDSTTKDSLEIYDIETDED